jgi:hypothetical protein
MAAVPIATNSVTSNSAQNISPGEVHGRGTLNTDSKYRAAHQGTIKTKIPAMASNSGNQVRHRAYQAIKKMAHNNVASQASRPSSSCAIERYP